MCSAPTVTWPDLFCASGRAVCAADCLLPRRALIARQRQEQARPTHPHSIMPVDGCQRASALFTGEHDSHELDSETAYLCEFLSSSSSSPFSSPFSSCPFNAKLSGGAKRRPIQFDVGQFRPLVFTGISRRHSLASSPAAAIAAFMTFGLTSHPSPPMTRPSHGSPSTHRA